MLLSLLETILVMHLLAKDVTSSDEVKRDEIRNMDCNTQGQFCFQSCHTGENQNQFQQALACPEPVNRTGRYFQMIRTNKKFCTWPAKYYQPTAVTQLLRLQHSCSEITPDMMILITEVYRGWLTLVFLLKI